MWVSLATKNILGLHEIFLPFDHRWNIDKIQMYTFSSPYSNDCVSTMILLCVTLYALWMLFYLISEGEWDAILLKCWSWWIEVAKNLILQPCPYSLTHIMLKGLRKYRHYWRTEAALKRGPPSHSKFEGTGGWARVWAGLCGCFFPPHHYVFLHGKGEDY